MNVHGPLMADSNDGTGATVTGKIIIKSGYLYKGSVSKKRRKFFRLVQTDDDYVHFEYFDQEPPADGNHSLKPSKKSINITETFAITRKLFPSKASSSSNNELSSLKYPHIFNIYTWNTCYSYACESEESVDEWIEALVSSKESSIAAISSRQKVAAPLFTITYDHVWQVTVKSVKRDKSYNVKAFTGESDILSGVIRICFLFAHKNLYIYKVCPTNFKDLYNCSPPQTIPKPVDIQLNHIRKIGHNNNNMFSIETGRSAAVGSLTLNVAAEDKFTAAQMHETILEAMKPDTSNVTIDKGRRPTIHAYQTTSSSGVRSVGASMTSGPTTLSEPDKISFEPVNDEYVDCDSFYSTDTFRDRAETLPQRTRFWSESRDTEYTDVTIVSFPQQATTQSAQHKSTVLEGAYFNSPHIPQTLLTNSQQSSTSHGSVDCEDEEGYVPMGAPNPPASQTICCSSPSSSMRPSRAYSYGSRPPAVSGSRTQIPTRSSILSNLNNSMSNASLNEQNSESKDEPCDYINGSHAVDTATTALTNGGKKSTKSSSVPVLAQPAPRERSSTVGSRPNNKKIK